MLSTMSFAYVVYTRQDAFSDYLILKILNIHEKQSDYVAKEILLRVNSAIGDGSNCVIIKADDAG